jgi:hypothetical protein
MINNEVPLLRTGEIRRENQSVAVRKNTARIAGKFSVARTQLSNSRQKTLTSNWHSPCGNFSAGQDGVG